jgi:hypothetical protein
MPHSAKELYRLAERMADASTKFTEAGYIPEGLAAANTCAIYTIGAELIDRLENMHFDVDGVVKDSVIALTVSTWPPEALKKLKERLQNDNKHKEQDSNNDSAGTKAAGGTEGK